jgi:hypothetical protein
MSDPWGIYAAAEIRKFTDWCHIPQFPLVRCSGNYFCNLSAAAATITDLSQLAIAAVAVIGYFLFCHFWIARRKTELGSAQIIERESWNRNRLLLE